MPGAAPESETKAIAGISQGGSHDGNERSRSGACGLGQPAPWHHGELHSSGQGHARARRFYEHSLGLVPAGAKPDGKFVYRVGATEIALFPRAEGTRATHTALSFRVADIVGAVRALEQHGVTFADYDLPGLKTVEHVCVLGAEKAAWFEDPEGNILCLHEDIG